MRPRACFFIKLKRQVWLALSQCTCIYYAKGDPYVQCMHKSNTVIKITMPMERTITGVMRNAFLFQLSSHILKVLNVKRVYVIKFIRQFYKREVKHALPVKWLDMIQIRIIGII